MQTEFPKLEDFLIVFQRSWEEAMKRQFDKKRQNLQELKAGNNVWLETKNIHLNRPSKKLDQTRYGPFKISQDIGQGVFQLKLLEG